MPEMDGYEVTRRIRTLEASQGVRSFVIAITALAMASERVRCQAAGMDDFLVKPVAPGQLLERIATQVARKPDAFLKPDEGASEPG